MQEHPTPRQDNVIAKTYRHSCVPPISPEHMAMIEVALTDRILPTGFDKRTCLLVFYNSMLADAEWAYQLDDLNSAAASWPHHAFINPLGKLRGGRLVLDDRGIFRWRITSWDDSNHGCSSQKMGKWTRFIIPTSSIPDIRYTSRYAWAKFPTNEITDRYIWTWLSQSERLRKAVKQHEVVSEDNILIGRSIEFELSFQTAFLPNSLRPDLDTVYLFIKDITSDNSKVEAYWATDPAGLDKLSATEMSLLGLELPSLSIELYAAHWTSAYYEALRIFHHVCGFDPDSNDVARYLGLPTAHFQPTQRVVRERRSSNSLLPGKASERIGRDIQWENGTFVWRRRRGSFSSRGDVLDQPWQWYKKLWDSPQCWLD
ncbi:hypothetical protein AMATHDRAFT_4186 [Amanita thiersii Skay4041]|uniref:Uncharacterized protein n=1 Tax=Amanita thiersii Skay4041 TaxID=703135 RepID=A0A2A9NR42_9AGAR|nr:hypothetical protein AMATHDRAFT_4186 [Amanita thiersii Skay4041]